MQDRYNFRAWHKKLNQMLNWEELVEYSNDQFAIVETVNFFEDEELRIMQCTGLKDKNGKLIYEWDILKTAKGNVFVDYDIFNAYFGVTNFIAISPFINIFKEDFEVIGNFYENRELLKNQTLELESEGNCE